MPYDTEEMALKRGLNSTIAGTGSHIVDIAKFKEGELCAPLADLGKVP